MSGIILPQETFIRECYVFDNYDGDTIYYHADLGYDTWATFLTGRLLGINSPEIRPLKTRVAGQAAKAALMGMVQEYAFNRDGKPHQFGHKLLIKSLPAKNKHFSDQKVMKKGKFGRWLVQLIGMDESNLPVDINQLMVEKGFAKPYGG